MRNEAMTSKRRYALSVVALLISLGTLYGLALSSENGNRVLIAKTIESKGGTIESVEERWLNIGPYKLTRYGAVYKIDYTDKTGVKQETWVKNGLLGENWVWDYKE